MTQRYDYEIVVESQLGPRQGTLIMEESGGVINGILSLLGFENSVAGKQEGQMFYLHHKLRTLVSHFSCRTELKLCGDALNGVIHFDRGSMKIHGRQAAETEGRRP